MSIADKLNYLITTKGLLKDNINKINNVLTDESTFRSYPQELFNGYLDILNNGTDTLWNNLEKVSQTGTEAVLEGVETAPMKMVLNGNTSQETTTGKNLFTGLIKNVRLDPNNGEEFSGSTGATTDFIPVNINSNISYYLSGLVDTIRSFTCAYNSNKEFLGRTSAQTVSEKALTVGSFTAGTPTGTGDIAYIRITQYIQGEGTIDIIDGAKMQLEQGSTATSWEKYTGGIPSPNPDYPQEVKVVKGENVVSVSGKNLIDQSNVLSTLTYNSETGYYEGTSTSAITTALTGIFEDNMQYTFKYLGYKENAESEGLQARFTYTDGTENHINFPLNTTAQERSITSLNGKTVASFEIRYLRQRSIHIKDLMLYRGTDINTPYVPYSKTDYPISLGTIELCKIGNYKDYFHKDSGKWYVHKEIGKYEVLSENIVDVQDVYTNVKYFDFSKPIDDIARGNYNAVDIYYTCAKFASLYPFDTPQAINKILSAAARNSYRVGFEKGTTLVQAQEKLNGSILYYVLATPTEEEITNTTLISQLEAINNAKSVKDKTYITQTNEELPFILDVEAIKEYEVV